jgi:hypothetical protein
MNMKNWLNKNKLYREAAGEGTPGGEPLLTSEPAAIVEPAAAPEAVDFSFIPEQFHVDGKPDLEKFKAHYGTLVEPSVAPDAYEYLIPEDMDFQALGLPEGMKLNLDMNDPTMQPLLAELSETLKGIGAPAEMGGKISGILAKYEAGKLAGEIAAQKEEFSQLGTPEQANQRISVVVRAMEAKLPADQVAALQGATRSAKAMLALETLLGPKNSTSPTTEPPAPDSNTSLSARYPSSKTK